MNQDDCKRILDNLDVIRHIAAGGACQFALYDCNNNFIRLERPKYTVNLNCLGGYRIHKQRIRISICSCVTHCCHCKECHK